MLHGKFYCYAFVTFSEFICRKKSKREIATLTFNYADSLGCLYMKSYFGCAEIFISVNFSYSPNQLRYNIFWREI